MAHTCPDCGYLCHCGGDIDDCCFDDSEEAMGCTCCFGKEDMDEDDYYDNHDRAELPTVDQPNDKTADPQTARQKEGTQ